MKNQHQLNAALKKCLEESFKDQTFRESLQINFIVSYVQKDGDKHPKTFYSIEELQNFVHNEQKTFGTIDFQIYHLAIIYWRDGPTIEEVKEATQNFRDENKVLINYNRNYSNKILFDYWDAYRRKAKIKMTDYISHEGDFGINIIKRNLAKINLSKEAPNGKHE